jgi:hypothetical protein
MGSFRIATQRVVVSAVSVIALAGIVGGGTASAGTFNDSSGGNDRNGFTTLNYASPHGNFRLRVWATKPFCEFSRPAACIPSDRYTIAMFDRSGRQVWSAGDQGDRWYDIGGNVTRVTVNRAHGSDYVRTNWQR